MREDALPAAIKIGAITYGVEEVDDLSSHDDSGKRIALHGHITWSDAMIRLDAGMQAQRRLVTLWHEILHGILEGAGYQDHPEALLQALAFGIVEVLRDNPALTMHGAIRAGDGDQ